MEPIKNNEEKARELLKSRQYKEAEELFSKVLRDANTLQLTKEQEALFYNDRGHCRYMQVCFDEAVEDYTLAIQLDPNLAAAYYNRGTVYYRLCAGLSQQTGGMQDNRKMDVSKLEAIPLQKLVKLLFLLDNGDKTTGTEKQQPQNIEAVQKARDVFLSILKDHEKGHHDIINILLERYKLLINYCNLDLRSKTETFNTSRIKLDEDLLTFAQACNYLGIECQYLNEKVKMVQDDMNLNENERNGVFFVYAENMLMNRICDCLTPALVFNLLDVVKNNSIGEDLVVTLEQLNHDGLKETLFFYIIRLLEDNNQLNRIYTDKLINFLEMCHQSNSVEQQTIENVIRMLTSYPGECQPAGLCIVFCVTEGRNGAEAEIANINRVFADILGFTVKIERNPSEETIENYVNKELQMTKYRYYDSVVYWFISHGSETNLILPNDKTYERDLFIEKFSKPKVFNKKPKIFFLASCQGSKPIPVKFGGQPAGTDGRNRSRANELDDCNDITYVYYEMDRLIAYATLPDKLAFHRDVEGSVFVEIVCSLLEKSSEVSITQVLETASRKIHCLIFKSDDNSFQGHAKQACFYTSTFQKTFCVPTICPQI
ncbi:caspase-8-like isoform X3 [Procambarus clarkii]|uniref:caspase-8-like isoform X3 n=1 Tax=Procambarus clarkii TaxID=6728 RepID=UPI00374431C9